MSFDYVKSIVIKDDKVYLTSAANNVSPITFERWECTHFSKLYQEGGLPKLLPAIAANVWEGNYHLRTGSKLVNLLNEGYKQIEENRELRRFLDTDHAAAYMSDYVMHYLDPQKPLPSISELEKLRNDAATVLSVCLKKPEAFDYASEKITQNREIAKEYIKQCSDMLMFNMPGHFRNDKELALLALPQNGCIYRHLSQELKADKDVIRLAFNQNIPRRYFEHLPDLIPPAVRKDIDFMKEIIQLCPRMHFTRVKEFNENKELVKTHLSGSKWSYMDLHYLSDDILKDKELQSLMLTRTKTPEEITALRKVFSERGLEPPKQSLNAIIFSAENRKSDTSQNNHITKEMEK